MEVIIVILWLVFFAGLSLVGLIFGKINERKHYRQIEAREKEFGHILVFNEKRPPASVAGQPFYLVSGSVVMAGDYFKQVLANLKQIIGGRLNSYESMLDRGRREAILRMKEEAARQGATMIFNVHLQTSTLGPGANGGRVCAEIIAYGTAWKVAE
ncbi:MAG: YbjQ family protein [Xanthomonadaceae bacterium]|jgi:uncharacterized protein YbjQ (UPF0145 family)|nr:YbjQ family protein [Xanthomonadaceae bacterium]